VTKTQSAGPISCLEHRATRLLHCAVVTRAAVLMYPLLFQTIISNQMRLRRLRGDMRREEKSLETPCETPAFQRKMKSVTCCGPVGFSTAKPRFQSRLCAVQASRIVRARRGRRSVLAARAA